MSIQKKPRRDWFFFFIVLCFISVLVVAGTTPKYVPTALETEMLERLQTIEFPAVGVFAGPELVSIGKKDGWGTYPIYSDRGFDQLNIHDLSRKLLQLAGANEPNKAKQIRRWYHHDRWLE